MAALRGELDDAQEEYQRAHDLAVEIGYRSGQADALCGLADVAQRRTEYDRHTSRPTTSTTGSGTSRALPTPSRTEATSTACKSRYDKARGTYATAIEMHQEIGFRDRQADCLNGLGLIAAQLADDREAETLHRQAQGMSEELGYLSGQAEALEGLAAVALTPGDDRTAHDYRQAAADIRRQLASS